MSVNNNGYTTINLPTSLVEELKVWKTAFSAGYGRTVSYAEMIRGMLDSLDESEPAVVDALNTMVKKHPDLMEKMSNYRGFSSSIAE